MKNTQLTKKGTEKRERLENTIRKTQQDSRYEHNYINNFIKCFE